MTILCLDIFSSLLTLWSVCISSGAFMDVNILTVLPWLCLDLISYYDNDDFTLSLWNDTFYLQIPMCLLHIQLLTPEESIRLHLWMPDLTLWMGYEARKTSAYCQRTWLLSRISGLCLDIFGATTYCRLPCLCGLIWVCLFQLSSGNLCGEGDATSYHLCRKHF